MAGGASALLLAFAMVMFAPVAHADFGLNDIELSFSRSADGSTESQAGAHPYAVTTAFTVNTIEEEGKEFVDGALRDLEVSLPEGLTGNRTAVRFCSTFEFLSRDEDNQHGNCPDSSAVGHVANTLGVGGIPEPLSPVAVYSLEPPPGTAAKLGFWIINVPVTIEFTLAHRAPYNLQARLSNTAQTVEVFASQFSVWGNPADPVHDADRGKCLGKSESCPAGVAVTPFVTMPRSCTGLVQAGFWARSWWSGGPANPGPPAVFLEQVLARDQFGDPMATDGCGRLELVLKDFVVQATSRQASGPTGLVVDLAIADDGLTSHQQGAVAFSDIKEAVVTLPEGVTANPSLAEGLDTCSPADLDRETLSSVPGEGCPQAAKLGSVEVESPALEGEILHGEMFIATPYENPYDTLLAFYIVIKHEGVGAIVKLAGKIEPDAETGQLISTVGAPSADPDFGPLPQQPISSFRLRLREGARSPLITPSQCGSYDTKAVFTPWANPDRPLKVTSSFQITEGVGGGGCPPSGVPPFEPGFSAGTLNNAAKSFSPFHMRLTRRDGDQDLTKFSAVLPPGLTGKIADVSKCPEAQIAAARTKDGMEERDHPSCPSGSRIGSVTGGAGVGSQLTYVEGGLYLAGPLGAAPLSVVAIVPAVAGPFDVGTVVTRVALRLNPITAQVEVDGASSERIPHILAGIPLKVRDIRVDVDRAEFTLNPTNCSEMQIAGMLWGGGSNVFSDADDRPVTVTQRFQAANCGRLGFRPRLGIHLKGGTRRGAFPALRLRYLPREEDANLARFALAFPASAFIEQGHFRTICTRKLFAAGAGFGSECPPGSVYGRIKAWTPLLDEPLQGPVFLRSSNNELPDVVLTLHGPPSLPVHFEVATRIDSVRGRLRAVASDLPDVPLSRVALNMQGGRKGLVVNSRDLCLKPKRNRARAKFRGQNGRISHIRPIVRVGKCAKRTTRRAKVSAGRRALRIARHR